MLPLIKSRKSTPSLLDEFFGGGDLYNWFEKPDWNSVPSVNVTEEKDIYHIDVAAPGLEKKDFRIDLNNDLLTVSSEKKVENEKKDGTKVIFKEFNFSSFSRSFYLPEGVDQSKIEATHENGILKISLPKREEFKKQIPRMIEIA